MPQGAHGGIAPGGNNDSVVSSWQEAEALAAWHMRELGFDDAEVTPSGSDGGLDVIASRAVAQVKHYMGTPVGAPAVQQLRGAAHQTEWVIFYALSGYTRAAITFAEQAQVALFTYDQSGSVRTANAAAAYLLRSSDTAEGARAERFVIEQEARKAAQMYFDAATSEFTRVARTIIEAAASAGRGHTPASRAAAVEADRVAVIVERVGGSSVPLGVLIEECDKILAAAERLKDDYLR